MTISCRFCERFSVYSICNSTTILNKAGLALKDSSFTGKQSCFEFVGLALPGVWQLTLQHFGEGINNFHVLSQKIGVQH